MLFIIGLLAELNHSLRVLVKNSNAWYFRIQILIVDCLSG